MNAIIKIFMTVFYNLESPNLSKLFWRQPQAVIYASSGQIPSAVILLFLCDQRPDRHPVPPEEQQIPGR